MEADGAELPFSSKISVQPVSHVSLSALGTLFQDQLGDSLLMLSGFLLNSHLSADDLISSCAQITTDFTQPLSGAGDPTPPPPRQT